MILGCWQSGESILLTGIRRTGKSELAKAGLVKYADGGGSISFLNVQDCVSLHDFYRDLLRQMPPNLLADLVELLKSLKTVPDKLLNWLRSHVHKVEVMEQGVEFQAPEALPRYWKPLVEAFEQVLSKHPRNQLPVLGIDELPFMLENLIRVGVTNHDLIIALASLRKLRDAGLRMIIAGSVSMENLLTLHGIPHTVLGGLLRLAVHPFDQKEAQIFLTEQLQGTPADSDDAISIVLDTLPDYLPAFLKIAAQYLRQARHTEDCRQILQVDALPAIRRAFLTQFDERLTKNYLDEHLLIAELVLDRIAWADADGTLLDGNSLPTGYRRVVQMLQYDNFILDGTDYRWRFSLNLLCEWWQAERGLA